MFKVFQAGRRLSPLLGFAAGAGLLLSGAIAGTPASAAIPGYQIVSVRDDVRSMTNVTQQVACPAGQVALSGSVVPLGLAQNPDGGMYIIYSGLADSQTWITKVHNVTPDTLHLVFSVTCANASW
jgi:hypothetical protein